MSDWTDLTPSQIAKQAYHEYRSTPTSGSALRLIEALASRVAELESQLEASTPSLRAVTGEPITVEMAERGDPPSAEQLSGASPDGFLADLEGLINRYSRENGSDTPDFILADYFVACLAAWDAAVTARERWYGRTADPVNPASPHD